VKAPPSVKAASPISSRQPGGVNPTDIPVAKPTEFRTVFDTPAPGRPAAWLKLISQAEPVSYPVEHAEVWIGTAETNRICVRSDAAVSRVHACIQWQGGDLYLLDNRSTNGSVVGGQTVERGTRVRLRIGDRIVLGQTVFSVEAGNTPG
jgi:hypothetical protein